MAFMQIAIGAIAIGVILIVAFLVIAQVRFLMPSAAEINDSNFSTGLENTQATVIAGFGLIAIGVLVVGAFGIVNIFR